MSSDLSERSERLWVPVAAPGIWAVHFTLCYITAALWCGRFGPATGSSGLRVLVGAYTAVAMAGMIACFVHGLRRHGYHLPSRTHDDDTPEDRRHFLAFTTMLLAGLSLVATGFVALAAAVVGECS
ncbi:MAG: hypothetical protein GEU82_08250 [Luteitalea sp.]|nr:hypothetical protein [Luteitalea sp.]